MTDHTTRRQPPNPTNLPFDSIVRVSRVGGREDMMSPDVQRADNAAAARRYGVQLAEEYVELDESGGKVLDRRGLGKAVQRALDGETAGIIVPRLNRFARNLYDATTVMRRLEKAGCLLISNAEGVSIGPDVTSEAALMRDMMIRMAEYERERYAKQLAEARERAIVTNGINLQVPFGYRRGEGRGRARQLVPDDREAEAVRFMFRRRAAGDSWRTISDALNRDGIATPRKMQQWTYSAVKRAVQNRVYLGEARSGGIRKQDVDGDMIVTPLFVNAEAHAPLVSRELWEQANERRQTPKRRTTHYLLAGLIRCPSCGVRMRGNFQHAKRGRPGGYAYYRCRVNHSFGRCPRPIRMQAEPLDRQVEALFATEFGGITFDPAQVDDTELIAAQTQLTKRERQLLEYTSSADYADLRDEQPAVATATEAAYRQRLRDAATEVDRLQVQRRGFRIPHDVVEAWSHYDVETKRSYLALAYGAISFDAAGVVRVWRPDEADVLDLPRPGHMVLRPLPVDGPPARAGKESGEVAAALVHDLLTNRARHEE